VNPFVYHAPIVPEAVIGREREAAALLEAIQEGVNATLYAPRRFGKTSLLGQVLQQAENAGMATVTVDLYGVLTRDDVAARISRAYRTLHGPIGRLLEGMLTAVGAGAQIGGTGASLSLERRVAGTEALLIDLLDLPVRLHERTGRPTVVAFDEFQSVIDVPGMDALLRSRIQHHGPAATYVFAGSEPSLLGALFNDRSRPLYGQAQPFRLGRLSADAVVQAVAARFEASNRRIEPRTLEELVITGAGHPQRTMLLAHRLWAVTPPRSQADERRWGTALTATLAQLAIEFETLWTSMGANERRVVAALAEGLSPVATRDGRQVGLKRPSSAQRAIESLSSRGVLETERGSGSRLVDPLLALWVLQLRAS